MSRCSFSYGTKFLMDGIEHVVKRSDRNEVVVELIKYKQTKSFKVSELEEAWDEERLAFEDPGNRLEKIKLDLGQLNEEENKIIKLKLKVLEPIIKGYYHTINLDEYLAELQSKGIEICKATFYNWKQIWDDYGDARFLLNGRPGPKKRRTEKEVLEVLEKIMDETIYGGEDVNYHHIYGEYKGTIKTINEMRDIDEKIIIRSFQTVWRIIKEKRDRYREKRAREGHVAANLERSGSKSTEKPERPLQRVELDWTPIDLYLVDPVTLKAKKPWLIYAIDVFSGNPLGFYITFEYPDSFAIKQCLLHSFLPKVYVKKLYPAIKHEWTAYGVPTEIVIDNASSNNSYDLEDVFNFFGIDPLFPEVAAGHKKGTVERGLKTFNDIVHTLKGTSFSNIFERKHYDSEGKACITLQAFYYIAHIIFIDIISHNYSNRRLGGTPHEKWEQGFLENPHLSKELPFTKKEIKLALCGGRERRIIQNKGVVLERVWFTSDELMKLRYRLIQEGREETQVVIRFDFSDVRKLYVENPYDHSFIEAYADPVILQDYEKEFGVEPLLPLPFQQIRAICLELGREARGFDDSHVIQAIKEIKQIQLEQENDKKNGYVKTLQEEKNILEGLAQQKFQLEELSGLTDAETFQYVGELTAEELKSTSSRGGRAEVVNEQKSQPSAGNEQPQERSNDNLDQAVDTSDSLPVYRVRYRGGNHEQEAL